MVTAGGTGEPPVQRWICTVCQYIYDPEEGDAVNNVPPQVPFTELTADWTCPVCKATSSFFVPL